jgi:hypothetical protein
MIMTRTRRAMIEISRLATMKMMMARRIMVPMICLKHGHENHNERGPEGNVVQRKDDKYS